MSLSQYIDLSQPSLVCKLFRRAPLARVYIQLNRVSVTSVGRYNCIQPALLEVRICPGSLVSVSWC